MEKQVVSKDRVANHGEVYTRKQEVKAKLDLVRQRYGLTPEEIAFIESRIRPMEGNSE